MEDLREDVFVIMEKHYTLSEASEILGVTTKTLRTWDNSGKLITIRTPGNQRRIPESEILRLTGHSKASEREEKFADDRSIILMCKDIEVYNTSTKEVLSKELLPGCMKRKTMSYSQWMRTRYSVGSNVRHVG